MADTLKRNLLSDRFVPYYYQIATLLHEKKSWAESSLLAPGCPVKLSWLKNSALVGFQFAGRYPSWRTREY